MVRSPQPLDAPAPGPKSGMSFELQVSEEAVEDLHALIDSLPESRRLDAFDCVESALQRLATNPMLASKGHLGRPTFHFQFRAAGVAYHWGCTFRFGQDETSICVTHLFRVHF